MMRITLLASLLLACGKSPTPSPKPAGNPTGAAPSSARAFHLTLGDATVYELVDRRWNVRAKPVRKLVLHADGTAELINDKTDRPMLTFTVKTDGTVLSDGQPLAAISEHAITDLATHKPWPLSIDGNTISLQIDGATVKVVLADDGNITVADRPDGNKWRIDAKDPAVRRTAFLVLALSMKTALD